jgi:hypothetical protein
MQYFRQFHFLSDFNICQSQTGQENFQILFYWGTSFNSIISEEAIDLEAYAKLKILENYEFWFKEHTPTSLS